MKILVIDNNPDITNVFAESLCLQDHVLAVAHRGLDAIAVSYTFQPDIAVCDWKLGERMDGMDVCKVILEKFPNMKVILVSGSPREEFLEASKRINPIACLSKPCDLEILLQAVESSQI